VETFRVEQPDPILIPQERLCWKWEGPQCGAFRDRQVARSNMYVEKLPTAEGRRELIDKHNYEMIVELYLDIQRNGMTNPLIVMPWQQPDTIYVVVVGNQRLAVCRALGWVEIPCIIGDPENDRWEDNTRLAKTYEKVPWDKVKRKWRHSDDGWDD